MSKLQMDFTLLKERLAQMQDGWTHGGFEWLDGTLVQALQAGDWLLMDNVNFCRSDVFKIFLKLIKMLKHSFWSLLVDL